MNQKTIKNPVFWLSVAIVALLLAIGGYFLFSPKANDIEEVRKFATNFANKVRMNQVDSVHSLYPAAELCDSFSVDFNDENVEVTETDTPGEFAVTLGNADFKVEKTEDGKMTVTESHGLFAYSESKMALAKGAGGIDPKLDDVQNAKRLKNRYSEYLATKRQQETSNRSIGLTFRTFTKRAVDNDAPSMAKSNVYQSRLEEAQVIRNLKNLGFTLLNKKTELRLDYTGEEYYDLTIYTYTKTTYGQITTVKLEEDYTEIKFPDERAAKSFFATAKVPGMRQQGNRLLDNPDMYWCSTDVEMNGNVVRLKYNWEP